MTFDIVSFAAITVICYAIGLCLKASPLDDKWIPCCMAVLGGALGAAAMFVVPEFPANDLFNAIAIGIVSGLAATGADQIYKQLR